jgi:hypothetical protein
MSENREDSFLPVQRILYTLNKARNLLTAEMDVALADTGTSYIENPPRGH